VYDRKHGRNRHLRIDGLPLNLCMRQVVRGQEDGVQGLFLMRAAMLRLAGVACHPMSHAGEM